MEMMTQVPFQYSPAGRLVKKLLHTQFGARIGHALGLPGFNRLDVEHARFLDYCDAKANPGRGREVRPVGDTGLFGFYAPARLIPGFNSRVDKGADLEASLLAATSFNSISSPNAPKYIALSTSTLTPAHGDTTLSGETSVAGLARAAGTPGSYTGPVSLDAACSFIITKTFTLTGSATTVVSAALFDASSVGNLYVEANFSSSAVMATNDQLTVNWTINL